MAVTSVSAQTVDPSSPGTSQVPVAPGVPPIDGPPAPIAPATITRDENGRATVRAVRLDSPWTLDGVLDEPIYANVEPFGDFIQQSPDEGAPASERTHAWIFYDDESIYVAARLWESVPESQWIANEMQRDSFQLISNDGFIVVFDTFYDRRNGFAFRVNPIGGFQDYQITDEGDQNLDWNPVWDVRTGRFEEGWTVEMAIPFKSLRFRPGASQRWGVQLGRDIRSNVEESYLTAVPISAGPGQFRLSVAGTLTGLEVPSNRTFEVKPYLIGSLATDRGAVPPVENDGDGDSASTSSTAWPKISPPTLPTTPTSRRLRSTSSRSISRGSACSSPRSGSSFWRVKASSTSHASPGLADWERRVEICSSARQASLAAGTSPRCSSADG